MRQWDRAGCRRSGHQLRVTRNTRAAFPRAILPLSVIGTSFIDLVISGAIFLVFALAYGVGVPFTATWVLLLVLVEAALVTGVTLLASALNAFARDVRLAIPIAVQIWLFLTPVLYPLKTVPQRLRIILARDSFAAHPPRV